MMMPGRGYQAKTGYRYGFNGKENDNEVMGEGNSLDFGARVLDPRIGRFFAVDPRTKQFPEWGPYTYALDNPIRLIDVDGEGPGDPLHHYFLTTVAIQIYDAAKERGASGRGALLIMAQASIESGYGQDAIKRGDYNLFGTMTRGNDYKKTTTHGRIKDYSNNGEWAGSIKDYFEGKTRKWPQSDEIMKKSSFTADDVDAAFYTGKYFESESVRNKTGHNSYNMDNISDDGKVNTNKYGETLLNQMTSFRERMTKSIDYEITANNAKIAEIDKVLQAVSTVGAVASPLTGGMTMPIQTAVVAILARQRMNLENKNSKLNSVKKDINQ